MQGNLTSLHAQVCKVAPDALSVHGATFAKCRRGEAAMISQMKCSFQLPLTASFCSEEKAAEAKLECAKGG